MTKIWAVVFVANTAACLIADNPEFGLGVVATPGETSGTDSSGTDSSGEGVIYELSLSEDATIEESDAINNRGQEQSCFVVDMPREWALVGGVTPADLPAGEIVAAYLRLNITAATGGPIGVRVIVGPWTEDSVTWNMKPPLLSAPMVEFMPAVGSVEVDLEPLLPALNEGGMQHGFLFSTSSGLMHFSSSEAGDIAGPILVVTIVD